MQEDWSGSDFRECCLQRGKDVDKKERKWRREACGLRFLSEGLIAVCRWEPRSVIGFGFFLFTFFLFISIATLVHLGYSYTFKEGVIALKTDTISYR